MAAIALVDDHVLLRNGLSCLIKSLGHSVIFEADDGNDFCKKLDTKQLPEIILMDINMPGMDGYETCRWLKKNHPEIKVLALSMYDNETSIITMLKAGAKGYILKDSDPLQLKMALHDLEHKGYYYSDLVNGKLIHAINQLDENEATKKMNHLSEREKDFLQFTCTELTYREIAEKMFVSPRTIDGYRDALFEKLQIKTRVGLAIYAIKNGLVDISKV
ncbi:MAG: response regulator transcription factor [Rhizobacter sp.]|nr:response regulator transcription factor [Ferruginibacter sp.]